MDRHHERRVRRATDGRNPRRTCRRRISHGADRRPTAARRISASRGRRSSSNTPRRAASITSTPSIAIRPMTTVRSSRASRRTALLLLATMAVAFGAGVSAHRLDEFLQAARIAVERDRVQLEMNLTPGIAGRRWRDPRDRRGSGTACCLRRSSRHTPTGCSVPSHFSVDDSPRSTGAGGVRRFPDVAALRAGDAAITIRSEAAVPRLSDGPHRSFSTTKTPWPTACIWRTRWCPKTTRSR